MSQPTRPVNLKVPVAISETDHRMLSQLCAHWASCQPDKPAIVTPQGAFTYARLNETVNRVAGAVLRIREQAGGGQIRVPLLFTDPFKHMAAIIGVEKAGVCHVSLNSTGPAAFLRQITMEVEPALILTETDLMERARELPGPDVPVFAIEALPAAGSDDASPGSYTLDDLHCIIFTSGSTGRPKGVMLSRYFEALNIKINLDSGLTRQSERILCAAAPFTALGCGVVRNTLIAGATVYLPVMSAGWPAIARHWLDSEQITVLATLPSLLRILFGEDESSHPYSSLQRVTVGGEAALLGDFELFKRRCIPGAVFSVVFGASEGGIYTREWLTHESVVNTPGIPLGKLMDFVEAQIVDEQMKPLPSGQIGEFVFRSPMIAAGYWKMPELTEQKFLPDPDGGRRRIYRTGDLGSISPDGTISFLGRADDEIKVNGNRVSLRLIEHALRGCPGIQNVTVQAQTRQSDGGTRIAAYYVAMPDVAINGAHLRNYLHERLPAYMIPAYFVRVEAIPLNANGKVDRFALPRAEETQRMAEQPLVAPRTDTERKIAEVWSTILGVKEIGVDDPFLDLGGDSLQAVRMLIQVNQTLGTTLDIPALNHVRTVAELAKLIESQADTRRYPPYMLLKEGTGSPLFLFHAVGGNVLVYQPLADRLAIEGPIYGILAQGLNEDEKPLISVPEIARHHIRQMKALQPEGPYYFGGYSFGGAVAYEVAQQLRAAGEPIGLFLALDMRVSLPKTLTGGQKLQKRFKREVKRLGHHIAFFATHAPSAWPPYAKELLRRVHRERRNAALRRQHDVAVREQVDQYLDEVDQVASPTVLAAIDAHHLALSLYRPEPYLGDVIVVLAQNTNFEGLEAWKAAWREAVRGELQFIEVPGEHSTMLYEPHVSVLAERLTPNLADAFGGAPGEVAIHSRQAGR